MEQDLNSGLVEKWRPPVPARFAPLTVADRERWVDRIRRMENWSYGFFDSDEVKVIMRVVRNFNPSCDERILSEIRDYWLRPACGRLGEGGVWAWFETMCLWDPLLNKWGTVDKRRVVINLEKALVSDLRRWGTASSTVTKVERYLRNPRLAEKYGNRAIHVHLRERGRKLARVAGSYRTYASITDDDERRVYCAIINDLITPLQKSSVARYVSETMPDGAIVTHRAPSRDMDRLSDEVIPRAGGLDPWDTPLHVIAALTEFDKDRLRSVAFKALSRKGKNLLGRAAVIKRQAFQKSDVEASASRAYMAALIDFRAVFGLNKRERGRPLGARGRKVPPWLSFNIEIDRLRSIENGRKGGRPSEAKRAQEQWSRPGSAVWAEIIRQNQLDRCRGTERALLLHPFKMYKQVSKKVRVSYPVFRRMLRAYNVELSENNRSLFESRN